MKGVLFTSKKAENYTSLHGWYKNEKGHLLEKGQAFGYCIPLKMCLGIAHDYDKAFINSKIEVVCIRSRVDNNCFAQKTDTVNVTASITVTKVQLHTSLIDPAPVQKLELINTIEEEKDIHVPFRAKN